MKNKIRLRDHLYLRWTWWKISRQLDISYDSQELNRLLDRYAEPQRHYHTVQHILECLKFIDIHFDKIPDVWMVRLAILYHDCVYVPGNKENESNSALVFKTWAQSQGVNMAYWPRVVDLILMTATHKVAHDAPILTKVMSDADMHVFLCPDHHYIEYATNIWREFGPQTGETAFRTGRLDFLGKLDSQKIFHMHQLKKYLHHARANIDLEIDLLTYHPEKILLPLNQPF